LKRRRHKQRKRPADDVRVHHPDEPGDAQSRQSEDGRRRPRPLVADDARNIEILLAVVALAAIVIRTLYLSADPPLNLSWSQALFTDGARAIDGARNRIMYGEWMTDKVSPVLLFYPISNVLAYLIYRIGGIGLAQANLTGVLPALGSLAIVYHFMRRSGGKVAGLVTLIIFAVPYVYVIYSRTPLLESLQIFLLVAAFVMLLRGTSSGALIAGLLVGAAAFMVKLHALHFAAVGLVFIFFASRTGKDGFAKPYRSGLFFIAGLGIAFGVWLAGVYSADPAAVSKYFKSNIILTQTAEYKDASLLNIIGIRVRQFFQVGSGIDMFFSKAPALSVLAVLGLISAISGFARGNRSLKSWEMLSAVWFVILVTALSFLSYRPLRYFIPLVPVMCLLATSLVTRLIRGEPLLHENKPRWFMLAVFIWLTWIFIHIQHDIIFQVLKSARGGEATVAQQSLARYDQAVIQQILVMGGAAAAIVVLFGRRLRVASWRLSRGTRKNLVIASLGALVLLNLVKFGDYCVNREYSILETAESLERVTSSGVFIVGDCSTTLSLQAGFRTLPSYGEIMRRDDREAFEQYPITHFLIRFPTLYEYLEKNYPSFATTDIPVTRYRLCGRDATVIRFEQWPGYPESYVPSRFERGMFHMSQGHVDNAYHEFEAHLEEHNDSYEALFGMAICLSVMDRADEARVRLDEAIEIAPEGALEYHVYSSMLEALLSEGGSGR